MTGKSGLSAYSSFPMVSWISSAVFKTTVLCGPSQSPTMSPYLLKAHGWEVAQITAATA